MTKLTTERLKTIATWREKYGNGANVMIPAEEAELMARRILAYEQAAKNPVASCWSKGGILQRDQFIRYDVSSFPDGEIKLFAAPVLPKQPELIGMKVSIDTGSDNIGHRLFGEIVGTSDSNGVPVLCIEVAENNGDMAAPAQPVIPEQQTVQLDPHVYRELVNELRDVALEYHSAQQLRERISRALSKAATAAHPHLEQPVSEPYKLDKSPESCAWISDSEGMWLGDCGLTWTFFDDGPNENGLKYCPSCGKKVSFIAAPAQESE
ncbi:hypothetical protein EYY98_09000 [Obesumbacterium proteus]|nr:hypothetical protein EYY98_09000 [Obesumbacterium proteus]